MLAMGKLYFIRNRESGSAWPSPYTKTDTVHEGIIADSFVSLVVRFSSRLTKTGAAQDLVLGCLDSALSAALRCDHSLHGRSGNRTEIWRDSGRQSLDRALACTTAASAPAPAKFSPGRCKSPSPRTALGTRTPPGKCV